MIEPKDEIFGLHGDGPHADTSAGQTAFGEVHTVAEARRYSAMSFAIDVVNATKSPIPPDSESLVEFAAAIERYLEKGDQA